MDDMSEPALAYEPTPAKRTFVEAYAGMPRKTQAEILRRLLVALERDDQRELNLLTVALRGVADPSTRPHLDPATAVTMPIGEFLAILDSRLSRDS